MGMFTDLQAKAEAMAKRIAGDGTTPTDKVVEALTRPANRSEMERKRNEQVLTGEKKPPLDRQVRETLNQTARQAKPERSVARELPRR